MACIFVNTLLSNVCVSVMIILCSSQAYHHIRGEREGGEGERAGVKEKFRKRGEEMVLGQGGRARCRRSGASMTSSWCRSSSSSRCRRTYQADQRDHSGDDHKETRRGRGEEGGRRRVGYAKRRTF